MLFFETQCIACFLPVEWATSLFDLDFRWAKAKAERWSLYLDQSSTKQLKIVENR